MRIIIIGCGKVGTTLLSNLVNEGHDVIAVDSNPDVIEEITNVYDVMCVCGSGTDCETLEEAEIEKCELLIAATGSDEFNMLSCFIAKRMGAAATVSRIRNPEYNDKSLGFMRQQLDLSLAINPELMTARELFNILKLPSAAKVETFSKRNFEIVEIRLKEDSKLNGMKLIDLRKKFKEKFLVCVAKRENEVYIPDGNFELKSGDKIGLTASPSEVQKLLRTLGIMQKQARNVMILGASKIAYYLSKMLLASGNSVTIIERDLNQCNSFAAALPNAVVIHGDGAKQELLLEAGLRSVDAFIALTGIDEQNLLISYFANSQNVPKVISKVNRNEFILMADKLGLECVISPLKTTSNAVVRYARALENSLGSNVETLYKLMDSQAEALEFIVAEKCNIVGIPLKEMPLKPNTLIAGIIRGRKTIIPDGDDVILTGDRVIVITVGQKMYDITDIIR